MIVTLFWEILLWVYVCWWVTRNLTTPSVCLAPHVCCLCTQVDMGKLSLVILWKACDVTKAGFSVSLMLCLLASTSSAFQNTRKQYTPATFPSSFCLPPPSISSTPVSFRSMVLSFLQNILLYILFTFALLFQTSVVPRKLCILSFIIKSLFDNRDCFTSFRMNIFQWTALKKKKTPLWNIPWISVANMVLQNYYSHLFFSVVARLFLVFDFLSFCSNENDVVKTKKDTPRRAFKEALKQKLG